MLTRGVKGRVVLILDPRPFEEFGFVQSEFRQRDVDSRTCDAKVTRYPKDGLLGIPSPRDFVHVNILTRSAMFCAVFLARQNFQILDSIIRAIPILVMNFLLRQKRPAKMGHHDQSVLRLSRSVPHVDPAVTRDFLSRSSNIHAAFSAIGSAHPCRRAATNIARQALKFYATMYAIQCRPSAAMSHKEAVA